MGHAYTPGLKVTAATEYVRARILPIPGEVLVQAGDAVEPDTVVARALLPGPVATLQLARALGTSPADVHELLLVPEGGAVERDAPIARSKGVFGMFKATVNAPTTGVLESVSKVSGQAIFREPPIPVEVRAYVSGTVSAVHPGTGVDVTARGTMVQGIFGIGPETSGVITPVTDDPERPLEVSMIRPEHAGAVLVGGALAPLDVLRRAAQAGVRALVVGGIDAADLEQLLGYDIGVAITGSEAVGTTLVVTEGFGRLAMSPRTFALLASHAGAVASVSGATQIRAGVLRPEVLVRTDAARVEESVVDSGELRVGSAVRIIRDPGFGELGRVAALPPEPRALDTEAKVRILTVALRSGEELTLPRANIELVDERL